MPECVCCFWFGYYCKTAYELLLLILYHVSNVWLYRETDELTDLKRCVRSMCRQRVRHRWWSCEFFFNQLRRFQLIEQRHTFLFVVNDTNEACRWYADDDGDDEHLFWFFLTVLFLTILIEVLFDHEPHEKSWPKLIHSWFWLALTRPETRCSTNLFGPEIFNLNKYMYFSFMNFLAITIAWRQLSNRLSHISFCFAIVIIHIDLDFIWFDPLSPCIQTILIVANFNFYREKFFTVRTVHRVYSKPK